MTTMTFRTRTAAGHWDRVYRHLPDIRAREHWWDSPAVCRHVRERALDGVYAPVEEPIANAFFRHRLDGRLPFGRALSIGIGDGQKEIAQVADGQVERFDLWDISQAGLDAARASAEAQGFGDRFRYHRGDAMKSVDRAEAVYDLVTWHHSLHHMRDVADALRLSRAVLKPGGVLFVDEYVGPNRLQWTPAMCAALDAARAAWPARYFRRPPNRRGWVNAVRAVYQHTARRVLPGRLCDRFDGRFSTRFPRRAAPPPADRVERIDPTEAVDSENILPALRTVFPEAEVRPIGGALFHPGLEGVIANIADDDPALAAFLAEDARCCDEEGLTHYAVAWAVKT